LSMGAAAEGGRPLDLVPIPQVRSTIVSNLPQELHKIVDGSRRRRRPAVVLSIALNHY